MNSGMIQGKYLGYSETSGGFTYQYTCEQCTKPFKETSPELSQPILCNYCYHNCPRRKVQDKLETGGIEQYLSSEDVQAVREACRKGIYDPKNRGGP